MTSGTEHALIRLQPTQPSGCNFYGNFGQQHRPSRGYISLAQNTEQSSCCQNILKQVLTKGFAPSVTLFCVGTFWAWLADQASCSRHLDQWHWAGFNSAGGVSYLNHKGWYMFLLWFMPIPCHILELQMHHPAPLKPLTMLSLIWTSYFSS